MDVVSGVRAGIDIIGEAAVAAGEAAAIASFPFLGWPVVKQIWEAILEKYTTAVLVEMQNSSTRILIPIIDDAQGDAATAAAAKLQATLDAQAAQSEEVTRELSDLKEKYAELIRMRQSTDS